MQRLAPRLLTLRIVTALAAIAASGCGYTVRPPYNQTVKTIYVPVTNPGNSFRRDINIQLTMLIVKEINDRTPYRVVANPEEADVTLESRVLMNDKNTMVENPYNLPRQIMASMSVLVRLVDNRTGVERRRNLYPDVRVPESATFTPEIGESSQAGFEKVMERLARDVVNMLEDPWGDQDANDPQLLGDKNDNDPLADRVRK